MKNTPTGTIWCHCLDVGQDTVLPNTLCASQYKCQYSKKNFFNYCKNNFDLIDLMDLRDHRVRGPHSENLCPKETLVHMCQETRTRLFTRSLFAKVKN